MSRRSSSLNRIDSGISRHLGNQYAEVLKVANNIDAVVKAASVDLEALALALEEATDFEGISVVSGSVAGWDPVTKVITVPTIKGDTGEDLSIVSIEDDGNGVFTWNFSDGTVFQTPSLTGPRGLQGIQGPQGEKGDFVALVNVTHQGNGIFKWTFDDGSSYTTPSLTGPQGLKGDKGDKGDKGEDLTIEQIVSNADGTFVWQFSDGTTYTTPNLKGPQGPKGEQGNKGEEGVSVHHLRHTSTTDPLGRFSVFGEYDTYTFYGDADETKVLGWFTLRNGLSPEQMAIEGFMLRSTYDVDGTGVVDDSERLGGDSLQDVHDFVTDRTGDTSLLDTTAEDLTGAVNEVRSTLNNLDDHVAAEVIRLDGRVDTEQSEREQDVLTLNTRVSTEVSTLNTRIDTEVSTLDTRIDTEVSMLNTGIDTEVSTLNTRITDEVSTLNTRVDTEVAALDNDIQELTQTLSTETAARTADVAGLNGRIDTVESAAVQESLDINTRITNEVSTLNTRVDTEVSTLNTRITSEVSDINSDLSALTADKYDKTGGHISGDVSISGKLTVQGGIAEVEAQQVSTSDTVIRLNDGEVGAGVTNGFAGVEIDRGTETDYEFGFNETTKLFEVGKVGDRQPLLTRMLSPVANKFFRWNDTTKQAETADVTWGDVTGKLSDVSKTEAETGTATTTRFWSSLRVREAILGWWNSSASKTKLDGIQSGAQVNSVTSVAGKTDAVTLAKADVGLANVDNTSDANKPVSTAQQNALNLKADKTTAIQAGNGLTGGGNLSDSRTVTLGTPGTLNGGTTNAVTAESHTHEISDATETVAGVVALATSTEVQAGTDSTRAVTPAGLSARTASETRTGLVEKATTAEALDGTADKFPDAAGVHAAFKQYGLGGLTTDTLDADNMLSSGLFRLSGIAAGNPVVSPGHIINMTRVNGAQSGQVILTEAGRHFVRVRSINGEWANYELHHNKTGATDAEAQAGTNTTKWVSSAGVKAHVDNRVTQSTTDTTVGRLLKVGDFGVGRPVNFSGNIDDISDNSTRALVMGSSATGLSNLDGYILENHAWAADSIGLQRISRFGVTLQRMKEAGVWSGWVRIHNSGNGATAAEVQAGTNTEKWISPAALSSRTATETRTGLVEKATNAEALAGTADKFPDAAGVRAAIAQDAPTKTGTGASGTWGISITGNAATATSAGKWTTARTITLSGDASGSITFDGSADKTLTVTVNDDSHNHTIANVDGLQAALDGKQAAGSYLSTSGNLLVNPNTSAVNPDTIASTGIDYCNSVSIFGQTDGALYTNSYSTSWQHQIYGDYRTGNMAVRGKNNGSWTGWSTVWTSGNDGSDSGLDADLLDGQQGSYYLNATNINAGTISDARLPDSISSSITGNAATATKLETSRKIGGVSFNGTADINLPGVNTAGNQNTSGKAATAGNADTATKLQTARTIGGVSFNGTANINLPGVNIAGNQNTSGNAATATKLQTAGYVVEYNATTKSLDFNFVG